MKDYLLANEDDHSFTLQHPDGSHFKIAKMALQQAMLDKIRGFQPVKKLAEGGYVDDENSSSEPTDADAVNDLIGSTPVSQNNNALADTFKAMGYEDQEASQMASEPGNPNLQGALSRGSGLADVAGIIGNTLFKPASEMYGTKQPGDAPTSSPMSGMTSYQPQEPQNQPSQDSVAIAPDNSLMNKSLGMMKSGIQGIANAKTQEANATVKAIDDAQKAQQELTNQYADTYKKLNSDMDAAKHAYMNGTIDPNRIWKSKEEGGGGGNKILAGIGMILGGIGSGVAGGSNPALDVIQKKIDQDIDAQKHDIGKNLNLYQMMRQKYGDTRQAELATRLQYNAALQAQVQKAAAISGSAQAQANAKLALGQLGQQQSQYQHQMTMLQMMAGIKSHGISADTAPLIAQIDPKMGETLVPVGNKAFQARTPEDAKELKKSEALYQPIENEIRQLQNMGSGVIDPSNRKRVEASLNRLGMMVNEFNGYNRFTEVDAHTIANQFNNPNALASIFQGKGATADTLKALQNKLESERRTRLWGYGGPSQYKTFRPGLGQ